jgi:simple sugar transport system permease protein
VNLPGGLELRIGPRLSAGPVAAVAGPFLSAAFGVAGALLVLRLFGWDPGVAARELALGAFGDSFALAGTLLKAIPLALCGAGLCLAYTAGVWNIGAEGQLQIGAMAATWFALSHPSAPAIMALPAMGLLALLGGGAWALVAGLLRVAVGANEIIVTLMLNYVAGYLVDALVHGPWRDPATHGFPFTPFFGDGAALPVLFWGKVHLGVLLAPAAAVGAWWGVARTRFGFRLRVVGRSERAGRHAGIDQRRVILSVMALSGALAGLAGMAEVAGIHHRLQPDFSLGYGFTAIIVAWLARLNPLAVVPVAVLMGGLLTGGELLQISMKIPSAMVQIIQGLVLVAVLGGEFLRTWRVSVRRRGHA